MYSDRPRAKKSSALPPRADTPMGQAAMTLAYAILGAGATLMVLGILRVLLGRDG